VAYVITLPRFTAPWSFLDDGQDPGLVSRALSASTNTPCSSPTMTLGLWFDNGQPRGVPVEDDGLTMI
jgi:hypothetical protein